MADDFNPQELKSAVASVGSAFEAFKTANDERLKQIEEKGSADPILEEKLGKIEATIDASQKRLDDFELAQKRKANKVVDQDGNEIDMDAKAADWAQKSTGNRHASLDAKGLSEYKASFNEYLRKGDRVISDGEVKALSVGSDPDGGYTVHPDMSGRISRREYETSPYRAYASIQVISSDALEGMFDNDEAASGWVAETASRDESDTPQIGAWRIPVHELSASPRATQKLLDDSSMNVEAWLANKVADKFARDESAAFTSGDGIVKPRGILTYDDYAVAGEFENGKIEQFDTGVNGDFAAAPGGGDVLIEALYGLKSRYRVNATWFMNRATTTKTRKLKDSDGSYLWQPGIAAGQPATLLGYPVASFEDMPKPETGSLSIAVGDMREAYQIVDRFGIRTLRDPYTAKPYVIFYTTKRVGGDVVNFEALKLVNFKA